MRASIAVLAGVAALAWPEPAAQAAPRVLVCHAGATAQTLAALRAELNATGAFVAVDASDCGLTTPSLATLRGYDAVLLANLAPLADRVVLGDRLADYADGGGGVVVSMYLLLPSWSLGGRWAAGYGCLTPDGTLGQGNLSGQPNEPQSGLVQGVASITDATRVEGTLASGATSVWDYIGGTPAIVRCSPGGHPRVDLNFDLLGGSNGDVALAARAALLYVAGSLTPLHAAPNPLQFVDTGTGERSTPLLATLSNWGPGPLTVTSLSLGGPAASEYQLAASPAVPFDLPAGGQVAVAVAFAPLVVGPRQATLAIGLAGWTATTEVELVGRGVGPVLEVVPSPVEVGSTAMIGQTVTRSVTVRNAGAGRVTVTGIAVTSGATEFALSDLPPLGVGLSGGASFPVTVSFAALAVGRSTGQLTITSRDAARPSLAVALSGSAGPPALRVGALQLAFATTNVGARSLVQRLALANDGFSTLHIAAVQVGGADPADFVVDPGNLSGGVAPAASTDLVIAFRPTAVGSRSASVTLISDDPEAPSVTVTLAGEATAVTSDLAPTENDFGSVRVGERSAEARFALTNAGPGVLVVRAIELAGTARQSFALTAGSPATALAPGATLPIGVRCQPIVAGRVEASLAVTTDVATLSARLRCAGAVPALIVEPGAIDFGPVPLGSSSAAQPVTLRNRGASPFSVSVLNVAGVDLLSFVSRDAPPVPKALAAGEAATFHLAYTPSLRQVERADLVVASDEGTLRVPLTGVGVAPDVTLAPALLDFGASLVGSTAGPKTLVLRNHRVIPVSIDAFSLVGPGAAEFTLVDGGAGRILGAGESTVIALLFRPRGASLVQATLVAEGGSPAAARVRGQGIRPQLFVHPASLEFGAVSSGQRSAAQVVELKNIGPSTLTIGSVAVPPPFLVDLGATRRRLAPGDSTMFVAAYAPEAQRPSEAAIAVVLEGQERPLAEIKVRGSTGEERWAGCAVGEPRALPPLGLLGLALFWRRRRWRP